MQERYRSWAERRDIIRSIIAETSPPPVAKFHLTESEQVYFRARSARMVDALARRSSTFKAYYSLPTAKPFGYVIGISALVTAVAISTAAYLIMRKHEGVADYPLLAACASITVIAVGWAVAGWITHRNAVRQNTSNMLFARFSHAPFGEALHRFHKEFGFDLSVPVTTAQLKTLRLSGDEEKVRAAASVTYILNYFELIASGVLRGDLDQYVVQDNVQGMICNYHDKCESHISTSNKANPHTFENLIKLRTHYREP